jgi:hypothetical protein
MRTSAKLRYLKVIAACVFAGWACAGYAECGIEDVVDLVDQEYSSKEIGDECDGKVVGAGRCSLIRVTMMAKKGSDADEIQSQCASGGGRRGGTNGGTNGGRNDDGMSRYCCDPRSGMKVCQIVVNPGPVGQACWCAGVPGVGMGCN